MPKPEIIPEALLGVFRSVLGALAGALMGSYIALKIAEKQQRVAAATSNSVDVIAALNASAEVFAGTLATMRSAIGAALICLALVELVNAWYQNRSR